MLTHTAGGFLRVLTCPSFCLRGVNAVSERKLPCPSSQAVCPRALVLSPDREAARRSCGSESCSTLSDAGSAGPDLRERGGREGPRPLWLPRLTYQMAVPPAAGDKQGRGGSSCDEKNSKLGPQNCVK